MAEGSGAKRALWAIVATVGGAVLPYVLPPPAMVALASAGISWAGVALAGAWRAVWFPVALPAWAIVVSVLVLVRLALRRPAPASSSPVASQLSDEEKGMIEMLAAADGDWVTLDIFATALGWRRLEAEHVAEKLLNRGYLLDNRSRAGTSLRLSPLGRDFALANHLRGTAEVVRNLKAAIQKHGNDWMRI